MSRESMCSCFKMVSQGLDICPLWSWCREFPSERAHDFVWSFGNSSHCGFNRSSATALIVIFAPDLPSISCFLSQAHGSGRPQELHLLAESERRCHSVCCAGLRHVQSTSQAAVIGQHETATSSPWSLCWLCPFPPTWKTQSGRQTNQPTRPIASAPNSTSSPSHNMSKKQMSKIIGTFYKIQSVV